MTITKRTRKDGSISYKAEVRKMRDGVKIQRTNTFDKLAVAKAWEAATLAEIEQSDPATLLHEGVTVKQLAEYYLADYGEGFGRSKKAAVEALAESDLGRVKALSLTTGQIIDHIRSRRLSVAPATALNDLVWLKALFRFARSAKGIPANLSTITDATAFCRTEKLVAKSRKRERRPTEQELLTLAAHFDNKRGIPMKDIMWFAVQSARRESEICRLLWADNEKDLTGLVRDAKHPTSKEGNHRRFKYTPEGWEIVQRQPKTDARIFPYNAKTVGEMFRRACKLKGIKDLKFHDLRHHATSLLFEAGYSIVEVVQFTLHDDWNTLRRYTHLKPGEVKHR